MEKSVEKLGYKQRAACAGPPRACTAGGLSSADNEIARLGGSPLDHRRTFSVPESTAFSDNDNIIAAQAC